jgi:ATP-binding cassette subfamily C protein
MTTADAEHPTIRTIVDAAEPFDRDVLVASGDATLFMARIADDPTRRRSIPGQRIAMAAVSAPAVIALPETPPGWCFTVSTGPGTELVDLAGDDRSVGDVLGAAIGHSVEQLGDALRPDALAPPERVIILGSRPSYVSDDRAAVVEQTAWVRAVEGEASLAGVVLPASGAPITPHLALRSPGFSALVAREMVEPAESIEGLRWLFSVSMAVAIRDAEVAREIETTWVADQAARSSQIEAAGVRTLARELEGAPVVPTLADDPLVAAAMLVGEAAGYRVVAPRAGLRGREGVDAVRAIAGASKLFMRRVHLNAAWYRSAIEPMIGFLADGTPVALVERNRRWVMIGADGAFEEISGSTTAAGPELLSSAFVLSATPLHERVTVRDLLAICTRGTRRSMLVLLGWSIVIAGVGLTVPLAAGVIFGEIIPQGERGRLAWLVLALIVAAVAVLPVQMASTAARTSLEAEISLRFQRSIWGRVLHSPIADTKQFGSGDLISRILALEMGRDMVAQAILGGLPVMLAGVLAIGLLFVYDVGLAVIMVLWGLVLLGIAIFMAHRTAAAQRSVQEATGEVDGFMLQVLSAIPKLHVAAAEPRAFAAWAQRFRGAIGRDVAEQGARQSLVDTVTGSMGTLVLFGAVAMTGVVGRDVGTFIAFQATNALFLGGVVAVTLGASALFEMRPVFERGLELVRGPVEVSDDRTDPGLLRGDIALHNVTFRYTPEMAPVLDRLDLEVRAGEMVALVGASGCGKSTILRVLLGFEQPEDGTILFDDQDLTSLDMGAVRRQMGVVMQDARLMPGSILQNLSGTTTLSVEQAWELAEVVALADDIRAMPMGLETMVSGEGGAFSGGQRQRLMIARALAARPRMLLLDEATSALDNVAQSVITKNLGELGMTRLVVAHRLSTVIDADQIVVIDRGRVREQGTFDELMSNRDAFYRLATRQTA